MRSFLLSILLLLFSTLALHSQAQQTTYQYFDLTICTSGSVGNDLSSEGALDDKSPVQIKARGREVFESASGCYGFCRRSEKGLACDLDSCPDFPLAGATYKRLKDKGSLPSFRCVNGCNNGVPKIIHDMGYETDESDHNIEWEKMVAKFAKICKGTKR